MEGTFSFIEDEVAPILAPQWSVRALSNVQEALSQAVRIAADPNAPINDAKRAFEKAASLTRINSQESPPGLRSQIIDLLSLKPVFKVKGYKRKILVAGIILHFLLSNYSTYRSSAIEITQDLKPAAEWVLENVEGLGADLQAEIDRAIRDLKKP